MTSDTQRWSFPARFAFRVAFVFFLWVHIPISIRYVPGLEEFRVPDAVTPWLVTMLFDVSRPGRVGSSDTAYNYAATATWLLLAVLVAAIWSVLDRRRLAYPRLLEGFRVYLRLVLAHAMIVYGTIKVIPVQFSPPSLDKLVQPLGDSSPMGLFWAFIGYSAGYQIFGGVFELLGGLLLAFRRTTLLGTLISIGVLTNVVVMNILYDVSVKIYSMHLLLVAIVLVIPQMGRLMHLLVLNRPVDRDTSEPLTRDRRLLALKTVLVLAFVAYSFRDAYSQLIEVNAMVSPIRGIWEVERITIDGVERPPLVTDLTRWRRFVFDRSYSVSFYRMDDQRQRFNTRYDLAKRTVALISRDAKRNTTLAYQQPDARTLIVTGVLDGQAIRAVCKRAPESFFLTSRGFHWINEKPLNR